MLLVKILPRLKSCIRTAHPSSVVYKVGATSLTTNKQKNAACPKERTPLQQ